MMKRALVWMAATGVGLGLMVFPAQQLQAQAAFGLQGNWGSEADFGVGGRVLLNIPNINLEAVLSADVFFPDADIDWLEFNGNIFYHFHTPGTPNVLPYAGAGLNVTRLSGNGSTTETGLNLAGGVRFPRPGITPFLEARAVISDADQIVLTFGFLFGPTSFR
jgi:hypothetical protein